MFFVLVACHIAKGGLLNVIVKEISLEANNRLAWLFQMTTTILKGHVVYR
jgi:hypothetical protein